MTALVVLAIILLCLLNPFVMLAALLVAWATPLTFWPCVAVGFAIALIVG